MGKIMNWVKGLMCLKKDKENVMIIGERSENCCFSYPLNHSGRLNPSPAAKMPKDSGRLSPSPAAKSIRSYLDQNSEEQTSLTIAEAAAAAYATNPAFAAVVVRLTAQGKGSIFSDSGEILAALKIQTVFRGFLARKHAARTLHVRAQVEISEIKPASPLSRAPQGIENSKSHNVYPQVEISEIQPASVLSHLSPKKKHVQVKISEIQPVSPPSLLTPFVDSRPASLIGIRNSRNQELPKWRSRKFSPFLLRPCSSRLPFHRGITSSA